MIRPLILWLALTVPALAQIEVTPGVETVEIPIVTVKAPSTAQVTLHAETKEREPIKTTRKDNNVWQIHAQSGKVWIYVRSIDFTNEKFDEKRLTVDVEDLGFFPPPPDPDPNPDPLPSAEYEGPNKFGLGKLSFEMAPEYSEKIAGIYEAGAEMLYGRPMQKVMFVERNDPNRETDYVLPKWYSSQMTPLAPPGSDWRKWYDAILDRAFTLNSSKKIQTTEHWYEAWREVAAGVRAKK